MSKAFETWSPEEYAAATEAQRVEHNHQLRAATEKNFLEWAARSMPKYPEYKQGGHNAAQLYGNALKTLRYAGEILSLIPKTGEFALGGWVKLGAAVGLADSAHLSRGAFEFRLAHTTTGAAYIDYMHNLWRVAVENPWVSGQPQLLMGMAAQRTAHNAALNFPWVRENPEDARAIGHLVTDPTMWAMFAPARKLASVASEVEALLPHVEGFKLAALRTGHVDAASDMVLASAKMAAAPISPPEAVDSIRAIIEAGGGDRAIAEQLHLMGVRAKQSVLDTLMGKVPTGFKSGQGLWPDLTKDLARAAKWDADAIKKAQETVRAAVPDFSEGELKYVQEAMHNLETNPVDPIGSFWDSHSKAVMDGVEYLDDAGKATGEKWYARPVSPELKERINKVLEIREQGLYIGVENPIRSKTPRNPSYGPSKSYADMVNKGDYEGALAQLEQDKATYPGWRRPQAHMGLIETQKSFEEFMAQIATRDTKVALEEHLLERIAERRTILDQAIAKARPGSVAKELKRLDTEISELSSRLAESGDLSAAAKKELAQNIRGLQSASRLRLTVLTEEKAGLSRQIQESKKTLAELRTRETESFVEELRAPGASDEERIAAIQTRTAEVQQDTMKAHNALYGYETQEGPVPGVLDKLATAKKANASPADIAELEKKARDLSTRLGVLHERENTYYEMHRAITEGAAPTRSAVGRDSEPLLRNEGLIGQESRYLADLKERAAELDKAIATEKADMAAAVNRSADSFKDSWLRRKATEKTMLETRLKHLQARKDAITKNPDAIYRGGSERFNDPTPAEQKLYDARESLGDLFQTLKKLKADKDYVRDIAQADPTGAAMAVLKLWDGTNRAILKVLTTYNPIVWMHETMGKQIFRMAAETGDVHLGKVVEAIYKGEAPHLYDALGQRIVIKGRTNEALFDTTIGTRDIRSAGDLAHNVSAAIENRLNALDELYQGLIKRHTYDQVYKEQLRRGVPQATAHRIADEAGERTLDRVQKFYRSKSPAQKALERVKMVPAHVMNYMYNWGWHAVQRPAEAIQVAKAVKAYRDHSIDKHGMYRIPGTVAATNPFALTEIGKFYQRMSELPENLSHTERRQYTTWRMSNSFFGEDNFLANTVMAAAGLAPKASPRSMGLADDIVGAIASAASGSDVMPSDAFFNVLGSDAGESREHRMARQAALYQGASVINGKGLLAPEQALAAVHKNNAIALASMALTGFPGMYAPPDIETALGRIQRYDAAVQSVPEGPLRERIREMMFHDPDLEPLHGAMRKSEANIFLGKDRSSLSPAEEKNQRTEQFIEAIKNSKMGTLIQGAADLFVTNAGATELTTKDGIKYDNTDIESIKRAAEMSLQKNPPSITLNVDNIGQPPPADAGTRWVKAAGSNRMVLLPSKEPGQILSDAMRYDLWQAHSVQLQARPGLEALTKYIDSAARPDGSNPVLQDLIEQAPRSAQAASMLTGYAHMKNQSVPIVGDLPSSIDQNHRDIATWMKNMVAGSDPRTADFLVNGKPQDVVAAIRAGKFKLNYGTAVEAYDVPAISKAQEQATSMLGIGAANWEKKQRADFKDFGRIVGDLQDAVRNPAKMDSVIEEANRFIKENKLPPNFWQDLDSLPQYRNLFENVGVAASFSEGKDVINRLLVSNREGRPVAMNHAALFEIAIDPKYAGLRPYVQAARAGYYGPEIATSINRGILSLPAEDQALVERTLGVRNEDIQEHFRSVTAVRGGMFAPSYAPILLPSVNALPAETGPQTARQAGSPEDFSWAREGYVARTDAASQAASLGSERAGWFSNAPGFTYQSPAQIINAGLEDYRNATVKYNAYQSAVSEGRTPYNPDGTVMEPQLPPSSMVSYVSGRARQQVENGSTAADINLAGQAIGALNSAAQGVYQDLQKTGDVSGEGDGAAAMYGLNNFASTWTNPGGMLLNMTTFGGYGLYVGIKSGLNFGGGRSSGPSPEQIENLRINQERLQLQREQFAENQRLQSIRDIRQREGDLAKAFSAGRTPSPAARGAILNFQRRGTFASRLGMVDALERELAGALTPRW